ncbi:MAG: PD40 domain-containing protein [Anaerolineaceae bacterium]|nr:PD40 domain-containing protein [Anaerolineaceae bacterium]MCB9098140.1 PD40 domain-containing protein [Anaerolineales bacterium]
MAFTPPTPTATFELAVFTTPTPTATATISPTPAPTQPTQTPTVTAEAPTSTPEAAATTESDEEETGSGSESSTSPIATPTKEIEIETEREEAPTPPPSPTEEPSPTPQPTPAEMTGRIAFPIDDGAGHYDVWVFEVPDGDPFIVQPRARQPNFSNKGQLLVNNQDNSLGEGLGLLDSNYTWLGLVKDVPEDSYPFWHPDGTRYAYSNPKALTDPITGDPLPHVFSPCSLQLPKFEQETKCQDVLTFGKVAVGEAPVWTEDDRIAFFSFEGDDGLYVVSGASNLWQGGVGSRQLLATANGRPSDTAGFQVFFSAGNIDQNWEAYSVDLDGSHLTNLSNAEYFQDGLPTVSPDGNWVAFVSDRAGTWGIWAVPRSGGEPVELLNLARINTNPSPWGAGDRDWTTERISWGP